MANTGWRLRYVFQDADGYMAISAYAPPVTYAEIWARAYSAELDAKAHPDLWPGLVGIGMEFVDGEKRL